MSNKKNIGVNYIYNLSYQLLVIIAPLITTPYVSRVLGADGIGIYSYTLSIVYYFTIFASLGLGTLGQLECAKKRDRIDDLSIHFWNVIFSKLVLVSIVSIIYIIAVCFHAKYKVYSLILTISIIESAFDISWFFKGLEEFKKIVIRNFIIKLIGIISIFVLVKNKDDLMIYILILQGTVLLGDLTLWYRLNRYIRKPNMKKIHIFAYYKKSLIYFLPTIAVSVYTVLDKLMIGWITNSAFENGYYEQAYKIQQLAVTVVTALNTVTLPRMAYLFSNKKEKEISDIFSNSLNFTFLMSLPITFGLIAISENLIPIFLGDEYLPCVGLLRVLSFMVLAIGFDNLIGNQYLIPSGKQSKYNIGILVGAIVNFVLNLILIPRYASLGAAIASVISEFFILGVFIIYSKDILSFKTLILYPWKYWVSSITMCVGVIFIGKHIQGGWVVIGLQIFLGILIYGAMLLLLKEQFVLGCINKFLNEKFKKRGSNIK
jgi:O-antigen/teichoic acid export membrane protein